MTWSVQVAPLSAAFAGADAYVRVGPLCNTASSARAYRARASDHEEPPTSLPMCGATGTAKRSPTIDTHIRQLQVELGAAGKQIQTVPGSVAGYGCLDRAAVALSLPGIRNLTVAPMFDRFEGDFDRHVIERNRQLAGPSNR
jgi:hypothetical protein